MKYDDCKVKKLRNTILSIESTLSRSSIFVVGEWMVYVKRGSLPSSQQIRRLGKLLVFIEKESKYMSFEELNNI